jgi:HK97 family phage major capsid protein
MGPAESFLSADPKSPAGPRPVGYILTRPVYTCRHLPALSASAAATKFGVFGNLKCVAYGEKGNMTVQKFESGSFGGKEIALADQTAMVMKKRWGTTITLPEGMVTIKTHA